MGRSAHPQKTLDPTGSTIGDVPPRILTTRHLNRIVLERQSLLKRRRGPITGVVRRIAGLQTQYAPSGYVGLWSRAEGLRRDDLTRALEQSRIVQATLMRATIHMVAADDYWPFTLAIGDARRAWWLRVARARDLDDTAYPEVAALLVEALADGPRTRSELLEVVGGSGLTRQVWEGASLWVDLLRMPPRGTWQRRRADLYGRADLALGPPPRMTTDAAVRHLISRYLGGFGPSTAAEIADWSGLPLTTVREALEPMSLRTFLHSDGTELVDLPRIRLPDPDIPAPVRFLPTWDSTLLVHARRSGILAEEHRPLIFSNRNPSSVGTFTVDGSVAGTWRLDADRVATTPFSPLPVRIRRLVEAEAELLTRFHA